MKKNTNLLEHLYNQHPELATASNFDDFSYNYNDDDDFQYDPAAFGEGNSLLIFSY